ncbi:MAG: hypothetical protein D6775_13935 [Caldilineae bacterium]|nr:MAG: hypothetical protein D6775_13935 [Caldilineae bacterium]
MSKPAIGSAQAVLFILLNEWFLLRTAPSPDGVVLCRFRVEDPGRWLTGDRQGRQLSTHRIPDEIK